jgi:hypothetical protein
LRNFNELGRGKKGRLTNSLKLPTVTAFPRLEKTGLSGEVLCPQFFQFGP